ncbi:MAG TPA: MFS transporter [Thermoanaerobaculia bacterium]|jgi:predicted MFS family arabinose efflux permease|nr:MFS transporter [Thermoanaerobaculia bacterium]
MFRPIAAAYRDAFSGLSRSVWLLSFATLINRSGTMVLPFLALFLTQERGFTATQVGQVLAVYGLGAIAASWVGGRLCDVIDPRRIMKWSLTLTGVLFLFLGHVHGRAAILIMTVVLSVVGEVFRPANLAALTAASDIGQRARSFALLRLAINLGMTLGPTVGGFLALYDYGWLFVADGATCLLAAALLQLVFPGSAMPAMPRASHAGMETSARSPWRDLPTLAIVGLMFLLNTVTFQTVSTFPLALRDMYGLSEARIGLALAVNTLIIVLFEMVLVHSLSGRNPLKVSGLGAFLFCAGFALLPLGSGFAFVVFTVVVWTAGEMLVFPIASSAVADRAPEEQRGTYMGLFNLAFAAAFVVAPLVGTWIYQNLGPEALWYGCGGMGVIVWAGFQAVAVRTAGSSRVPVGEEIVLPEPKP